MDADRRKYERERQRKWAEKNKEKLRVYQREYQRRRRAEARRRAGKPPGGHTNEPTLYYKFDKLPRFFQEIERERVRQGFSIRKLAEAAGYSENTWYMALRREGGSISLHAVVDIAQFLGLELCTTRTKRKL